MAEQKIIDRDTYRSIKKMTHEEMQDFLMRYADGLLEKDGRSIDLREVEKDLVKSRPSEISALKESW